MKNSLPEPELLDLPSMSRRRFVTGMAAGSVFLGLGLGSGLSFASPQSRIGPTTLRGSNLTLILVTSPSTLRVKIEWLLPSTVLCPHRYYDGARASELR